jgi:16S rRNA (uracil1498-N3)-methyltransferase
MQSHRFYTPPDSIDGATIRLSAAESHHLCRVLRLPEGSTVFAFDGVGREWECEVSTSHKSACQLTIRRQLDEPVESPLQLTLAQALVKGDKFDLVVQKATELGVTRIVPVITEHCESRRAAERSEQRLERWQRISLEALKQCRRRHLVTISNPLPFPDLCRELAGMPALLLAEHGGGSLPALSDTSRGLTLLVGPEGGWSERELNFAGAAGITLVHLGPRILRTETAAITGISLVQYLYGDLSPI